MGKWSEERDDVLRRLTGLEQRLQQLEAAPGEGDEVVTPEPGAGGLEPKPEPIDSGLDSLERAWSAIFSGSSGVQVAIVKANDPRYKGGPFVVEDNKESIKGEGDSVEAALANYLELGGKRTGEPESLPAADMEQIRFFATPGNVAAPTSCRHSGDGYVCDYFRSPTVHSKTGTFPTTAAAIAELRRILGDQI